MEVGNRQNQIKFIKAISAINKNKLVWWKSLKYHVKGDHKIQIIPSEDSSNRNEALMMVLFTEKQNTTKQHGGYHKNSNIITS